MDHIRIAEGERHVKQILKYKLNSSRDLEGPRKETGRLIAEVWSWIESRDQIHEAEGQDENDLCRNLEPSMLHIGL